MVYLIRRALVEGDWGKVESAGKALVDYWSKQPGVKGAEVWSNIAGPQDEFRFVAKFDSLADEEKFAMALWSDPGYEKVMMDFVSVFRLADDSLLRAI